MPALRDTRALSIAPPAGAVMWGLTKQALKTRPGGGNFNASDPVSAPDPAPDGSVISQWPVAEFSKARVLEVWGPGKYRVHWYDASGRKMHKDLSVTFEVAEPTGKKKGARLRGAAAAEVDGELEPEAPRNAATLVARAAANGGQLGVFDVFSMIQNERAEARAERQAEIERQRIESQQRIESDRNFMMTIVQVMTAGRAAGGGVDMAAEMGLLRRELALATRENNAQMRAEIAARLEAIGAQREPDDDEPDGDDELPDNLEDAGRMVLKKILHQVAGKGDILQQLMGVLQGGGVKLSQAEQAQLQAIAQANGGVPRA
jgi:hypothetical protein